jgi:hypothetical protein
LIGHFRSWSFIWDLVCSFGTVYLLQRNLPHWTGDEIRDNVVLYICISAFALACLVAYRRANSLRTETSWTDPAQEDNHGALLTAEVLCSIAVVFMLLIPPFAFIGVSAPSALVPSAMALPVLLVNLIIIVIASVGVFFLLSGYTLGTEGYSVFAWVIVVLGFSRSEVADRVTDGLSGVPFLPAPSIGAAAGAVSRVFTPPIEELIKSSMAGTWAGHGLHLAQGLLIAAFTLCLSAYIVTRWGKYDRRERREIRAQGRQGSSAGDADAA